MTRVFLTSVPEVQDGAAALVLVAVALLVDLRGRAGRVALRHGVEVPEAFELVVTQLLPVNPEREANTSLTRSHTGLQHTAHPIIRVQI